MSALLSFSPLELKDLLLVIVTLFAPVLAVFFTYRYALKQIKKQSRLNVQEDLRKRKADALHAAWALLQSMTEAENGRNFLRYQEVQVPSVKGAKFKKERVYSLHIKNAQVFVYEHLPHAFYAQSAGLHWSKEVKNSFFEVRNILYGLLLSVGEVTEETCEIENAQLAERLRTLYEDLNERLRQEMREVYAAE